MLWKEFNVPFTKIAVVPALIVFDKKTLEEPTIRIPAFGESMRQLRNITPEAPAAIAIPSPLDTFTNLLLQYICTPGSVILRHGPGTSGGVASK